MFAAICASVSNWRDSSLPDGIADARGAAADQRHRAMAVLLQQAQDHDADQVADMQAVRGAVEADIRGHDARAQRGVERLGVGALEDEATVGGFLQKLG